MNRSAPLRSTLSALLPALILALSVVVPMLDSGVWSHEIALESHHDPGTCPTLHDHTVCTQVGHNASLGTRSTVTTRSRVVAHVSEILQAVPLAPSPLLDGPPPRAPPGI